MSNKLSFLDWLYLAADYAGLDADNLSASDAKTLTRFIGENIPEPFGAAFWPDLTLIENRAYRLAWSATKTDYVAGDEVWYEPARSYFRALCAVPVGEAPQTSLGVNNDAYWAQCAPQYVAECYDSTLTYKQADQVFQPTTGKVYQCIAGSAPAPYFKLDASAITGLVDGDKVATWGVFTQTDAATRPVYRTNRVNGLPAVTFDGSTVYGGTNQFMTGPVGDSMNLQGDSSFFFVGYVEATKNQTVHPLLAKNPTDYSWPASAKQYTTDDVLSDGKIKMVFDACGGLGKTYSAEAINTNAFTVIEVLRRDGVSYFYSNGVLLTTTVEAGTWPADTAGWVFHLGRLASYYFSGELAEMRLYSALTEAQRKVVSKELVEKYAIATGSFPTVINDAPPSTNWSELEPFRRTLSLEQEGMTKIGDVARVMQSDPRVFPHAAEEEFYLTNEGITAPFCPYKIWLEFRKQYPAIKGDTFDATQAYSVGAQMLFTDGELYDCVVATTAGQTPVTHPASWSLVYLPAYLRQTVCYAAAADFVATRSEKDSTRLDTQSVAALEKELDRFYRVQGQGRRTNYKR